MIELFQKNQLESVMQIWLNTNIFTHNFIRKDVWYRYYDEVKILLPQSTLYLYKDKEIIKGFIGITNNKYISGLFILEKWQSQGIGKQLIDYCKKHYNLLELDVFIKNTKAISFYQKHHFKIINQQKNNDTNELEYHMKWQAFSNIEN